MKRQAVVGWLRQRVPEDTWEQFWWMALAVTLLLLPVGLLVFRLLGMIGWMGAGRASQGLALLAVVSGFVVGSVVLWSVNEAGLKTHALHRAQWFARVAIFGPLFTLLIMFWIAKIT